MKKSEIEEKTCALIRRQILDARNWAKMASEVRAQQSAEWAKSAGTRNMHLWGNLADQHFYWVGLRREAMRAARRIANVFGHPCARRTA